jgi:hypothetical protein
MRAYCIIPLTAGNQPAIDLEVMPLHGWGQVARHKDAGVYLISGSDKQIDAVLATPGVVPITKAGETKAELDEPLTVDAASKLATWVSVAKLPPAKAGATAKAALTDVCKAIDSKWCIEQHDLDEPAEDDKPPAEPPKATGKRKATRAE